MVFPREILIIKNAQIFYINFRLRGNIFILYIIKHAKFWLVSESLLVRMKNCNWDFLMLRVSLTMSKAFLRSMNTPQDRSGSDSLSA